MNSGLPHHFQLLTVRKVYGTSGFKSIPTADQSVD
jgi:hypothetical protein